jgi:hypothetical protein
MPNDVVGQVFPRSLVEKCAAMVSGLKRLSRRYLALRGRGRRGRGRRRRLCGTARSARTHAGATGTGHHRHHRRTAGPTRTHARGRRSTREDEQPLSGSWRRAAGTARTAGTEHAVVVMAIWLVMPGDCGAGEEDNRHDENNAGDDHHPCRNLVEPGRLCYVRRRSRVSGSRLDRGFRCFSHLLIMPRLETTIKRPAHEVTVN